jgi:PAS domain S-box-containing protein
MHELTYFECNPHRNELIPSLKFLDLTQSDILDDHFPEGVFLINTRWQVGYFNRKAEEITGFSRDEVMGKFCWDVFRADQCQKNCPMRITMSTGEVLVDQEVEITTKAGLKKLIMVNTAQIKRPGNVVLGGVETFHHLLRNGGPNSKLNLC